MIKKKEKKPNSALKESYLDDAVDVISLAVSVLL